MRFAPRGASAQDPVVATMLWGLFVLGVAVVAVSLLPGLDEVRKVGLPAIGGVLLLIGAYFTARNLRQTSQASFVSNLLQAAQLLADDDEIKRHAGRRALEYMAADPQSGADDDRARRDAALAVLATADQPNPSEENGPSRQ